MKMNNKMGNPLAIMLADQYSKMPQDVGPDNTRLKNQILNQLTGAVDWKILALAGVLGIGVIWLIAKK